MTLSKSDTMQVIRKAVDLNREEIARYARDLKSVTSDKLKNVLLRHLNRRIQFQSSLEKLSSKAYGKSLLLDTNPFNGHESVNNSPSNEIFLDDQNIIRNYLEREVQEVEFYSNLLEKFKIPFPIYHLIRKHKMIMEVELYKIKNLSDLNENDLKC